jgi:hypothetical protein
MCVCVSARVHVRACMCMYAHVCECVCVRVRAGVRTQARVSECVCSWVCMEFQVWRMCKSSKLCKQPRERCKAAAPAAGRTALAPPWSGRGTHGRGCCRCCGCCKCAAWPKCAPTWVRGDRADLALHKRQVEVAVRGRQRQRRVGAQPHASVQNHRPPVGVDRRAAAEAAWRVQASVAGGGRRCELVRALRGALASQQTRRLLACRDAHGPEGCADS